MPTKFDDLKRKSAQQQAMNQACMPQAKIKTAEEQIREARAFADRIEKQEKDAKRQAKRERKARKRQARIRRNALDQLIRLSQGNGTSAVRAAQALTYYHDETLHENEMPF